LHCAPRAFLPKWISELMKARDVEFLWKVMSMSAACKKKAQPNLGHAS
jgi:hypothetical protein